MSTPYHQSGPAKHQDTETSRRCPGNSVQEGGLSQHPEMPRDHEVLRDTTSSQNFIVSSSFTHE